MKRVVIFTDSKWRDLPGAVYTKLHIESNENERYDVSVVSPHLWESVLSNYSPHVVILNHVQGSRNRHIASQTRRNGGIVLVQFNEGIIEFESKAKIFSDQKTSPDVGEFLCWNLETAKLVNGIPIGCPRFDTYGKMKHVINKRELFLDKYNLQHDKKIVLWNDSWPSARFTYQMQDFHRNNWRDLGNTAAKKWENADEFAVSQFKQQEQFKRYVLEAQEIFPEVQMIVKSHPMSDYLMWERWSADTGIPVIHGEYIFDAINAADVIVAKLGSITVAESWLLNKNVVKLGKDYYSASSSEQFEADILNVSNMHDLCSTIDMLLDTVAGKAPPDGRGAYLTKWGLQPLDASKATADIVTGLLSVEGFNVRTDYRPIDFESSLIDYDRKSRASKMDNFGNWDKAITQRDVSQFQMRVALGTQL